MKSRSWLLTTVVLVLAPSGVDVFGQRPQAQGLEKLTQVKRLEPDDRDRPLVNKLIDRYNVAADGYRHVYSKYARGLTGIDPVFDAGVRLYDSRIELAEEREEGPQEKMRILVLLHEILVEEQAIFQARVDDPVLMGTGQAELTRVKYARLGVEIEIERTKKELAK